MTTLEPLARVVQTCIAAPSQWDAWTTDGTRLTLRYRHGIGRVWFDAPPGAGRERLAYWDDRGGSFITLEDFMAKAELTLGDGAVVVPLNDEVEDDHTGPESLRPAKTAAADPSPAAASPTPFLQGTFALYVTPGGGAVLAYRAKGSSDDKQLMIPPFILQMAAQSSGLSPEEILSRIQSGSLDG